MENITAKVSCFARAYHYKNSTSPIFADTAAEALLGQDYDRIAESMTQGVGFFLPGFNGSPEEGLRLIVDRQLSPSVLGRSAYCERMLKNEIRLGCRQCVIFASGYDTFTIRNSNAPFPCMKSICRKCWPTSSGGSKKPDWNRGRFMFPAIFRMVHGRII